MSCDLATVPSLMHVKEETRGPDLTQCSWMRPLMDSAGADSDAPELATQPRKVCSLLRAANNKHFIPTLDQHRNPIVGIFVYGSYYINQLSECHFFIGF